MGYNTSGVKVHSYAELSLYKPQMSDDGEVSRPASEREGCGEDDDEKIYHRKCGNDGALNDVEDDPNEGNHRAKPEQSADGEADQKTQKLKEQNQKPLICPILAVFRVGHRHERQKKQNAGAGAYAFYPARADIVGMKTLRIFSRFKV